MTLAAPCRLKILAYAALRDTIEATSLILQSASYTELGLKMILPFLLRPTLSDRVIRAAQTSPKSALKA